MSPYSIGYSVIVALTGLPIGYSVIVALTGLPIGYTTSIPSCIMHIEYFQMAQNLMELQDA